MSVLCNLLFLVPKLDFFIDKIENPTSLVLVGFFDFNYYLNLNLIGIATQQIIG